MTAVLLDTHALLWWLYDDSRLSSLSREILAAPERTVYVSPASAWEITTKARLGRLDEAGDVPDRLTWYVRKAGFGVLPITLEHAAVAGRLLPPHKDPFDRMIAAQSMSDGLPVVTADAAISALGAKVLW